MGGCGHRQTRDQYGQQKYRQYGQQKTCAFSLRALITMGAAVFILALMMAIILYLVWVKCGGCSAAGRRSNLSNSPLWVRFTNMVNNANKI